MLPMLVALVIRDLVFLSTNNAVSTCSFCLKIYHFESQLRKFNILIELVNDLTNSCPPEETRRDGFPTSVHLQCSLFCARCPASVTDGMSLSR